jgi:hypothetical protein
MGEWLAVCDPLTETLVPLRGERHSQAMRPPTRRLHSARGAWLLELAKTLAVAEFLGRTTVEEDSAWDLIRACFSEALQAAEWSYLNCRGVDEASSRKSHNYGTAFLEIAARKHGRCGRRPQVARLLISTACEDKDTFLGCAAELECRSVPASQFSGSAWTFPNRSSPVSTAIFHVVRSVSTVSCRSPVINRIVI